jgi:uncharacterized integral membrane protein
VRNFWVYRRLIALAMVLGLMLWFIWANNTPVTIAFPFGLGKYTSTTGWVILLSAVVGSLATALLFTVILAVRSLRGSESRMEESGAPTLPDDRPPADYAAKTTDGFPESRWS